MARLLEVKTYEQPNGCKVTLRRFDIGYERLVNDSPQEWGTTEEGDGIPESRMAAWGAFEASIHSKVL